MVHSKTPGGQQPSEAFLKEQASTQGKGSHSEDSAPQHPLNVPVASDSGDSNVGITEITNNSANKSGAFPSKEGEQNVGVGAPTANVPGEQKTNA